MFYPVIMHERLSQRSRFAFVTFVICNTWGGSNRYSTKQWHAYTLWRNLFEVSLLFWLKWL